MHNRPIYGIVDEKALIIYSRSAGGLVQWLKLPAWKVGDRELEPHPGLQASNKQNVFSPLTRKDSML